MVHAAQLARQADFADGGDMVADRLVEIARRQRQHGGKIRRRFVHAESADDVQKRVAAGHLERAALFEHRHQHGGAVVVKAVACPPRDRLRRGRKQCLHLGQHRALAFHHTGDAGAGRVVGPSRKQHFRRVRHFDKAFAAHFEYADLVRRAEAVFRRAQDAIAHVRLTLEI